MFSACLQWITSTLAVRQELSPSRSPRWRIPSAEFGLSRRPWTDEDGMKNTVIEFNGVVKWESLHVVLQEAN